jgi:hypothetical protein
MKYNKELEDFILILLIFIVLALWLSKYIYIDYNDLLSKWNLNALVEGLKFPDYNWNYFFKSAETVNVYEGVGGLSKNLNNI